MRGRGHKLYFFYVIKDFAIILVYYLKIVRILLKKHEVLEHSFKRRQIVLIGALADAVI